MEKLADDWITKGRIDFEYKKFILLAYLQHVSNNFDQYKLYPSLADLILHYKNASQLKEGKNNLWRSFPKRLSEIDLKSFRLFFESKVQDDHTLGELEEILDYALSELQAKISVGKDIFDEVEKNIFIEPIGIKALEENEGLLLVDPQYDPFYHIYHYRITFFETANEKIRGLHTNFIDKVKKSISTPLEQLKLRFLKNIKLVSNYSAFRAVAAQPFPFEETLMPIVKRSFSQYLAGQNLE